MHQRENELLKSQQHSARMNYSKSNKRETQREGERERERMEMMMKKKRDSVLVMLAEGQGTNDTQNTHSIRGCLQYKHIAQLVMERASDVPLNDVHVLTTSTIQDQDKDKKMMMMMMERVKRVLLIIGEECAAKQLASTVSHVPQGVEILMRKYSRRTATTREGRHVADSEKRSNVKTLTSLALLAGLEPVTEAKTTSSGDTNGFGEEYEEMWVQKPKFSVGSAMKITRKKPKTVPAPVLVKADDDDDDDDALVDEDALLTEEDRALPMPMAVDGEGCAPRRKACANCSCGRRDAELAEEEMLRSSGKTKVQLTQDLTEEQINNPQSACGSVRMSPCPIFA